MFFLVEEFFSIQGEGKYAGVPSYFLRTGGCNLTCKGFKTEYTINNNSKIGCDTFFAVDKDFTKEWQKIKSSKLLIENLKKNFIKIGYKPHLIITGGEPLLYAKDKVFYEIIEWLILENIQITFETNGTIDIDFNNYPAYKSCIFSLSIKLSNSLEPKNKRVKENILKNIIKNSKESFFKFTIDKNLIETTALKEIEELKKISPKTQIYCMPIGESRNHIWKNDKAVFNFCIKNNFFYSDRLHIRVFDTTQGV